MSPEDWEEKSRIITQKVVSHPFFLCADAIYCYVDYRQEVGTRSIIEHAWKAGKKVAVPKIVDDYMEFYYISDFHLEASFRSYYTP
jgi:5-formyltetrahydrofolate cyclo-ligase